MAIRHQFARSGQLLQRLALPQGRGPLDQVEHRRVGDEEAAVDHCAVAIGFLAEIAHPIAVELDRSEASGGCDCGNSGTFAVGAMERDQRGEVDRSESVAIGKAERLIGSEIRPDRLQSPAGLGIGTGFDQGDLPRLRPVLVNLDRIVFQVDRDVGGVEEVIGEIFLDQIAFVAKANDEVVHAVGGIELHDVPDDRHSADLDHRFGANRGLFPQPGPQSAGKNHRLHFNFSTQVLRTTVSDQRADIATIRTTGPPTRPGRGRNSATVRPPASKRR